jgi:hypothetical protein
MLRRLKDLERFKVTATDGDIGHVVNLFFDDERWIIRYLIVETGGFLHRHRVLISPIAFGAIDWPSRRFHVRLTVDKVKNSPTVDVDKPVSRQHESDYNGYYNYPYYWDYPGPWGTTWNSGHAVPTDKSGDVHLRSVNEVRGYHIQGSDQAIGNVADFIVDDETWEIRYLVVDTREGWFGNKVLLVPQWAHRIGWLESRVYVEFSREKIKNSPAWQPGAGVNREYEALLCNYYGRPIHTGNDSRSNSPPTSRAGNSAELPQLTGVDPGTDRRRQPDSK